MPFVRQGVGAYSRLLPGAPAFSCCAEHNVQLSLVIYIPRYLHQVYFSTQAPRTRGRGAGVLHPQEGDKAPEGTRNSPAPSQMLPLKLSGLPHVPRRGQGTLLPLLPALRIQLDTSQLQGLRPPVGPAAHSMGVGSCRELWQEHGLSRVV